MTKVTAQSMGTPQSAEVGGDILAKIEASITIAELLKRYPQARQVFDEHGLKGCGGERGPAETLAFFARVHQVNAAELVSDLNRAIEGGESVGATYRETLADYIYRRFFKAGIAILLTIGGLWGVINLLAIESHKNLLQMRLVPSIHAHAHAMIFGWVGLFVMGFAYQSFPRFKYTTLWRPRLANATLFLMLGGIGMRTAGELLIPSTLGMALGGLAGAAEIAAIGSFVLILAKTAAQSAQPRNVYEKFIFCALGWFVIQAVASDVFFFAKALASTPEQLVARIALLDAPLREIQLIGFATLMILGVSQRFVPTVYNLGRPKRDRQTLIFYLLNTSLLLAVVSFPALLHTGNIYFALALEFACLLMAVWAVLAAIQLRIFTRPSEPDRSWKFIRASYVWLLIATLMLPLMPFYDWGAGQAFSHAYWGGFMHALTVGFISMMIIGVSSRVVPILAGVNSKQITALWGVFILLNLGCAGRVVIQILTDFFPHGAYSLIGATGVLEIAAFAWWGVGLWRIMNLSKVSRARLLRVPVAQEIR